MSTIFLLIEILKSLLHIGNKSLKEYLKSEMIDYFG